LHYPFNWYYVSLACDGISAEVLFGIPFFQTAPCSFSPDTHFRSVSLSLTVSI